MVGFHGTLPSPQIIELIRHERVGGVILFSRNIRGARQTLALTTALQAAARAAGHTHPLLIASDQENGLVRRLGPDATAFPGAMALGATGDERLAEAVARATGDELRALGITMNLAPVADVNSNATNPVIGVRSFGEDPRLVGTLVAATVRGLVSAGVIATLKHFPGHGDTRDDSHLGLPTIPHALDRLTAVELAPFVAGIAAGAPAVMSAHLDVKGLPGARGLPATLAPAVLRGLLRERLGFGGVIVTDCLEMGGITETVGSARGAVLSLGAGADLVLVSHHIAVQRASIAAVREAIARGELAAEVIEAATRRLDALRRGLPAWDALPTAEGLMAIGSASHVRRAAEAHQRAMTLVRDRDGLLPLRLSADERLLVVGPKRGPVSQAVDLPYAPRQLVESLRRWHLATTWLELAHERAPTLASALDAAEVVVVATINAHRDPTQVALVREVARSGKRHIVLALCDPYDLLAFPEVGAYLATYDYAPPALDAAAAVLFGERPAPGHLPVTLPGIEGPPAA